MIRVTLPYPLSGPGVYRIVDRVSRRFYIGSSVNMQRRWTQHRGRLAAGTHPNPALQAIWNADPSRLAIEPLMATKPTREALLAGEQLYLDWARAGKSRTCLNVLPVAGSHLGRKRSAETLARMSASQVGKKASAETRARQSQAAKGRPPIADETRERQSQASKRTYPNRKRPKPRSDRALTPDKVRQLRALRAAGMSWRLLAKESGLALGTTKRAVVGVSYAEVA